MPQANDKNHLKLVLEIESVMVVMVQANKMIGQSRIHLVKIMYVSLLTSVLIAEGLEYVR